MHFFFRNNIHFVLKCLIQEVIDRILRLGKDLGFLRVLICIIVTHSVRGSWSFIHWNITLSKFHFKLVVFENNNSQKTRYQLYWERIDKRYFTFPLISVITCLWLALNSITQYLLQHIILYQLCLLHVHLYLSLQIDHTSSVMFYFIWKTKKIQRQIII